MAAKAHRYDPLLDKLPRPGRDPASVRRRVEALEGLFERLFVVPGIRKSVGLDAILGIVPVAGDLAGTAMGLWLIWEARNLGLSKWQISRMVGNVGLDTLLGAIPVVGIIPDMLFRSNTRNLKIIKRHLDRHHPSTVMLDAKR